MNYLLNGFCFVFFSFLVIDVQRPHSAFIFPYRTSLFATKICVLCLNALAIYFRFNCGICSVYSLISQINCVSKIPIVDLFFLLSSWFNEKNIYFSMPRISHIVLIDPFHNSNHLARLRICWFINKYSRKISAHCSLFTVHRSIINGEHYRPKCVQSVQHSF